MKTHGLMFKDEMVRAILAGQKTQTRRLLGTFYDVGDRIYVKEAYRDIHAEDNPELRVIERDYRATYKVGFRLGDNWGGPGKGVKWKSSMFMPRIAARIWLEVTDARVERLQAISERDAMAEGAQLWDVVLDVPVDPMKRTYGASWKLGFQRLWESIHGKDAWAANPEVRALTFRHVPRP